MQIGATKIGKWWYCNGNSVAWSCKKQTCIALSTQEAEFIAGAELCKSLLGLRQFF
jgi:hypothetical protein